MYDRTTKFLNDHALLSPMLYGVWSIFLTDQAILDIGNTRCNNIGKGNVLWLGVAQFG